MSQSDSPRNGSQSSGTPSKKRKQQYQQSSQTDHTIEVTLRRKLQYKGHVMKRSVNVDEVRRILKYLKEQELYNDPSLFNEAFMQDDDQVMSEAVLKDEDGENHNTETPAAVEDPPTLAGWDESDDGSSDCPSDWSEDGDPHVFQPHGTKIDTDVFLDSVPNREEEQKKLNASKTKKKRARSDMEGAENKHQVKSSEAIDLAPGEGKKPMSILAEDVEEKSFPSVHGGSRYPFIPVKTADGAASDETHPLKNTDADDKENEFHKLEEENNAALADETQPPKDIHTAANDDGNPVYDPENYECVPLHEEDAGEEEAANGPQPMES